MLSTPFGNIKIFADDTEIEYEVEWFEYIKPPVKDKPLAGCYRIYIPVKNYCSIRCVLELENESVDVSGSSGERYLCREFCDGSVVLAIGAEDENPAFETERVKNGMEYHINSIVDEVVFGIAWAMDYEGIEDVRVWFAADPTVFFMKEVVMMKELENALAEQIADLEINTSEPCETAVESVYLDRTEADNSRWLEIITPKVGSAKQFEIHCWNEETEWIEVALQYGVLKDSTWKYGKAITGDVTQDFINMLLNMEKPKDTEIYNKMTPFFNVFLDDDFQSCHYGTEIYIEEKKGRINGE